MDGWGFSTKGLFTNYDRTRVYFPAPILSLGICYDDNVAMTKDTDFYQGYDFIEAASSFSANREYGVIINGSCGFTSVPADIKQLCLAMTQVTTGLAKYTYVDEAGSKVELTKSSMPAWVKKQLEKEGRHVV